LKLSRLSAERTDGLLAKLVWATTENNTSNHTTGNGCIVYFIVIFLTCHQPLICIFWKPQQQQLQIYLLTAEHHLSKYHLCSTTTTQRPFYGPFTFKLLQKSQPV